MALTGKTIGQLTFLESPTADTLIPAELSGETYHIAFSGISSYTEITYDELYSSYTGATLTPGKFYLITDFQSIYDQPDFDQNGNEILGNYKIGDVEPLVVLATSGNTLAPQAYSPTYPKDKITYDITFNQTERNSQPAKGRITERIDDRGNRADYDLREVLFKRYNMYYSDVYYQGTVDINSSGDVTGTNTLFTSDFSIGDYIGIHVGTYSTPTGPFRYFEITNIASNTSMSVTGKTMIDSNGRFYSRGRQYFREISPFQSNIVNDLDYAEYNTFGAGASGYNVYIGNYANLFEQDNNSFLLSNNVFLGSTYEGITLGNNCYNNSFDDDMDSLVFGYDCHDNIITNDFDRNYIGNYFIGNIIMCDVRDNQIGNFFQFNMLGDNDGFPFNSNKIANYFEANFTTFYNGGFEDNTIGDNFSNNLINSGVFSNNISVNFNDNKITTWSDFANNNIKYSFYQNVIDLNFNTNNIEGYFYNNQFSGGSFQNNIVGKEFNNNSIFNSEMRYNTIGKNFNGNLILGDFEGNTIGYDCKGNIILDTFSQNQFGNAFTANNITGATLNNVVLHGFISNNIYGTFQNNRIGSNFFSNEILDGFGFGAGQYQGNIIGNDFYDNNIGEYFYNNVIPDNFYNNTIGNYFQWNTIQNYVNGFDFGYYYGNLTAFTYTAAGSSAADNIYVGVGGVTNNEGQNATFDIEVSGNAVVGVSGNSIGRYYHINDTITISGTSIGGSSPADDVVITVTGISPTPSVYESYSCQIFMNSGNNLRLSYYNSGDTITITDINL